MIHKSALVALALAHGSFCLADAKNDEHTKPAEIMVVSGNRIGEPEKDSTISISVINETQIADASAQHPNEMLKEAPGLWISRGNGQEHLTAIRSPVFTGAGACGNFLIAEDGIPVRAAGFCNINQLFDTHYEVAERVEVFRGPNSSIYGSNALYGGLAFFTPSVDSESKLNISTGSYDDYRLRWQKSMGDQIFWGSLKKDNGYRDDSGVNQQKLAYKSKNTSDSWSSTNSIKVSNLEQETAGYVEGESAYKDERLSRENDYPEAFRDVRSVHINSANILELNENNQLNITPYYRFHEMEFLMHFVPWQPLEENGHQSLGVKSSWQNEQSEQLKINTGFDLEFTRGYLKETQADEFSFAPQGEPDPRFPQGEHYDYQVDSVNAAFFVHGDYRVNDALKLSSQLRIDQINYRYTNNLEDGSACEVGATGCRFYRPEDQTDRYNAPSYRLAAHFEINPSTRVFSNVSQAFRAPQTSELYRLQSENTSRLDKVEIQGMEFGLRHQNTIIEYQLSLYAMKLNNGIFQNTERSYIRGTNTSHHGIEYQFKYLASKNFSASLSGSWSEHTYENSPDELGISTDIKGNTIDTAPKKINHLSLNWQVRPHTRAYLSIDAMDEYYLDPENSLSYGGHTIGNIGAEKSIGKKLKLRLAIKNITDRRYAERADVNVRGEERYFPGLPRRALFEVEYQLR